MKRVLAFLAVAGLALMTAAPTMAFTIKKNTESLILGLNPALDSAGNPQTPDSAHILTYADNGTTVVFKARSVTYPFSDISIDTTKDYGTINYWLKDNIANIDGAGGVFDLDVFVVLWVKKLPTYTEERISIISDPLDTYLARLDAAVTTRLAPTTAGRTLDVTTTGEAGLDLSNTNGTLDAAEVGAAAFTSAKFAGDFGKMVGDSVWGKDTTSNDYPAGSWGQILETPTYVQGAAASIDSATISRIVGRKVWGISAGSGSDSSTLVQRFIDSTRFKLFVAQGVYATDSNLTLSVQGGTANYSDSIRTMGYWLAPKNFPTVAQFVDSIWDEDSTGHYTSPNLAFTTAQGGGASVSNAQMGAIGDSVWNKLFTTAFTAGSMGDSLNNSTWVRGVQYVIGNILADSVWKVDTTGRGAPGKMGQAMNLNSYTSASILARITGDSVWGKDTTSYDYPSGSWGQILETPTYVQGVAASVDSGLIQRIVFRGWGIPAGTATAITTIAQRTTTVSAMDNNVITASVIATDAIGAPEIASNAIDNNEVADGTISALKFATGAIDATAIATDAIGSAEVADGSIDAGAIAQDAIGSSEMATNAIGSAELAPNAITNSQFADGTITSSKFGANAINASVVADATIDNSTFAANAIDASIIATNSFTSDELALSFSQEMADIVNDSVWFADSSWYDRGGAAKYGSFLAKPSYVQGAAAGVSDASVALAVWNLAFATAFTAGSMGDSLNNATFVQGAAASVDSAMISRLIKRNVFGLPVGSGSDSTTLSQRKVHVEEISNDAITAASIAPGAIGSQEIADGAIDNSAFADNALSSEKIASNAIGSDEMAGDAIGASEIADNAINSAELGGSAAAEIKDSVGAGGGGGGGQYTLIFTIKAITGIDTAGAVTIQGASVSVNNLAQTGIPEEVHSDLNGQVIWNLNAGSYVLLLSYPGFTSNVDSLTVTGSGNSVHYITRSTVAPRQPTIYAQLRDNANQPAAYAIVQYQLIGRDRIPGSTPTKWRDSSRPAKYNDSILVAQSVFVDTTDATGYLASELYSNRFITGPDTTYYNVKAWDRNGGTLRLWTDWTFRLDTASNAINLSTLR